MYPAINASFHIYLVHGHKLSFLNVPPDFSGELTSIFAMGVSQCPMREQVRRNCPLNDQTAMPARIPVALQALTCVWGAKIEDNCRSLQNPRRGQRPKDCPFHEQ